VIYATLHTAIRDALSEHGICAELAAAAGAKVSEACFSNPVIDDLLLNGRKIAGAAQRRTRGGFLHQGSIQLPNLAPSLSDRFARLLGAEIEQVNYSASLIKRAATLTAERYSREDWQRRW
jgi:lipoate-protein ligase A